MKQSGYKLTSSMIEALEGVDDWKWKAQLLGHGTGLELNELRRARNKILRNERAEMEQEQTLRLLVIASEATGTNPATPIPISNYFAKNTALIDGVVDFDDIQREPFAGVAHTSLLLIKFWESTDGHKWSMPWNDLNDHSKDLVDHCHQPGYSPASVFANAKQYFPPSGRVGIGRVLSSATSNRRLETLSGVS